MTTQLAKVTYAQLSKLTKLAVGTSVIVTDKNNAVYTKQADGSWKQITADTTTSAFTSLGDAVSAGQGAVKYISDFGGTIARSDGVR